MSSEDEEAVEAELNELIIVEHQKAMDNLPTVPSDELPVTIPGNYKYNVLFKTIYVLKYFHDLETKEKDNLPTKKIALEAQ